MAEEGEKIASIYESIVDEIYKFDMQKTVCLRIGHVAYLVLLFYKLDSASRLLSAAIAYANSGRVSESLQALEMGAKENDEFIEDLRRFVRSILSESGGA